ncbi:MAG TPA: asparagine synthase-related protein [Vicinamibacterales bacterium]|nr:asparagine synthase-related protein [Vicinamibacterales bacterium]
MFEPLLRVNNVYWSDDAFRPRLAACETPGAEPGAVAPEQVHGRFACASASPDGSVSLARDRFGLNKLFVAVHESGTLIAANYLTDLVARGVPLECIYSVPAGHAVHLDPRGDFVSLRAYAKDAHASDAPGAVEEIAVQIRRRLERWFARFAAEFAGSRIAICLSGGIDSSIIAALATRYFAEVTAYTFAFTEPGRPPTDDAVAAERLAHALRIPLRTVAVSAEQVMASVDDAICYGQDWRDFNVHCAIVNEILARAIAQDAAAGGACASWTVLTGDLANELLADYTPVVYAGRTFYALPDVGPDQLRSALVRGLDAGDREVGIFSRYGIDVIQPYAFAADLYLRLPGSMIARDGFKQALAWMMAGDLLPAFVLDRRKVRAQIGSASPVGILPVLLEHGCDQPALRRIFCRIFGVHDEGFLDRFIRAGRYRVVTRLTGSRSIVNGHTAA